MFNDTDSRTRQAAHTLFSNRFRHALFEQSCRYQPGYTPLNRSTKRFFKIAVAQFQTQFANRLELADPRLTKRDWTDWSRRVADAAGADLKHLCFKRHPHEALKDWFIRLCAHQLSPDSSPVLFREATLARFYARKNPAPATAILTLLTLIGAGLSAKWSLYGYEEDFDPDTDDPEEHFEHWFHAEYEYITSELEDQIDAALARMPAYTDLWHRIVELYFTATTKEITLEQDDAPLHFIYSYYPYCPQSQGGNQDWMNEDLALIFEAMTHKRIYDDYY